MKPTTKKPKARVMFAAYCGASMVLHEKIAGTCREPGVWLPCATKKQAQQIVRFFNKTEEERVEEMAEEMHTDWRAAHGVPGCERWEMIFENQKEPYRRSARAIHALIFGGTGK